MTVTTKQQIIKEVEAMSESELTKVLRLLQSFGLTKHNPKNSHDKYPLTNIGLSDSLNQAKNRH